MQIIHRIETQLREQLQADAALIQTAAALSADSATNAVKGEVRARVTAGLGSARAGNAVRARRYIDPNSLAGVVLSNWRYKINGKDVDVLGAYATGATISKPGGALALPLPAAGRKIGGGRMTPEKFMERTGLSLRLVKRPGRPSLLVTEGGRLNSQGLARFKGGKKKRGQQGPVKRPDLNIPVFQLVQSVRLRKRIELGGINEFAAQQLQDRFMAALGTNEGAP